MYRVFLCSPYFLPRLRLSSWLTLRSLLPSLQWGAEVNDLFTSFSVTSSDLFKARLPALILLSQSAAHPPTCPRSDRDLALFISFQDTSIWLMNPNWQSFCVCHLRASPGLDSGNEDRKDIVHALTELPGQWEIDKVKRPFDLCHGSIQK